MNKLFIDRVKAHVSSSVLALMFIISYTLTDGYWLESYLPYNGKPMFILMMVGGVILYELIRFNNKLSQLRSRDLCDKLDEITRTIEVDNLKQAVNAIYNRFKDSSDEWITSENLIKEINELKDKRVRLEVNSYTEYNLNHLCSKIKRG